MPSYQIICDDLDITKSINKHFSSLSISEGVGGYSDSLTLVLADPNNTLAIPRDGAQLSISIGFDDKLTKMGLFIVDEISIQSPPSIFTITARAAPFRRSKTFKSMLTQKNRYFENISLSSITRIIASEYKLESSIAKRFDSIKYKHIHQQNESDLNLLKRLTDDLHARLKITEGKLALVDLIVLKTNRGLNLPRLNIKPNDVSRWQATLQGRTQYKSVITSYRDLHANKTIEIQAGTQLPVRRLPHLYDDKQSAIRAAKARLQADLIGKGSLKITMTGAPTLRAMTLLNLNDFRKVLNHEWQVLNVEHSLTRQGFTTSLTATSRN